jgi:hypothetical protein
MKPANLFKQCCQIAALAAAFAARAPAASLSEMATNSDAIVVGTVTTLIESGSQVSFDLLAEGALKGDGATRLFHVSHQWIRRGVVLGAPPVIHGRFYGIWCLRHVASSDWEIAAANGPDGMIQSLFWRAAGVLPAAYQSFLSAGAPLLDALAFEIAAGVETEGLNPETALYAVGPLHTAAVHTVFAHFLSHPNSAFQAVGLAGLLAHSEPGSIAQLTQAWPSIPNDQAGDLSFLR